MKKSERTYRMYLEDILQSMERISEYISEHDFDSFKKDPKTVDAVVRNFEIIGEASKNLPEKIRSKYAEVPWKEMYYLRNKITHEYFGIDYSVLWDIAHNYLPEDQKHISRIIEREF